MQNINVLDLLFVIGITKMYTTTQPHKIQSIKITSQVMLNHGPNIVVYEPNKELVLIVKRNQKKTLGGKLYYMTNKINKDYIHTFTKKY